MLIDTFIGEKGSNYRFYSIAVDSAGNEEKKKDYDAQTTILTSTLVSNTLNKGGVFKVYPNPIKEDVNIEVTSKVEIKKLNISIYDSQGKFVYASTLKKINHGKNNFKFSLKHLPFGVYLYKVNDFSSNFIFISGKLIKYY